MNLKFKNGTYDNLKWVVQVFLPAFIALVGVVGQSLAWEHTEITMTLLGAFTGFMGTLLGISNIQYKKEENE